VAVVVTVHVAEKPMRGAARFRAAFGPIGSALAAMISTSPVWNGVDSACLMHREVIDRALERPIALNNVDLSGQVNLRQEWTSNG
jgi:hypothetical protein